MNIVVEVMVHVGHRFEMLLLAASWILSQPTFVFPSVHRLSCVVGIVIFGARFCSHDM